MTQDSNAGERNEPEAQPDDFAEAFNETPRELTPAEIQHAKEMQEIADGHRYMPQEMRDARDAKPERPKKPAKSLKAASATSGERIAKVLARAGLASRREIERLIGLGKISVNGRILETPAVLVSATDIITVDGQQVGAAEPTRLWRYHKPVGLVTTERDPEGRPTVFDKLPSDLPRVLKVGRLDLNSEGLLLLTNDGELARALELPSSGWVRRYRARALGHTTQARLDSLKDGTTVDGVIYGPIEATLDKLQEKADGRANVWITVSITEGKNREVRRVLESIGLKVNRLIRLAYGPFQLGNLEPGEVEEVGPRVIREMLSEVVQLRNLPIEGASQTSSARPASRFTRDRTAPGRGDRTERNDGPQGRRGGGDRFKSDKPAYGDRPSSPRPAYGDRPAYGARPQGDRPQSDRPQSDRPQSDRPRRDFAEKREYKPRDFDERPRFEGDGAQRDRAPSAPRDFVPKPRFEDRPRSTSREDRPREDRPRDDRPRRDFGAKPAYGDRPAFKKPYTPREGAPPSGEAGAYERAKREFGGEKPAFTKPYAAREGAEGGERRSYMKPNREGSPQGGKSYGDRPQGGDRAAFKKPYASRDGASGGERAYSDRPKRDYGDRPQGDRPAFKKPYASRDNASGGAGGERSYSDRPKRDYGDKPAFKKPYASRDGATGGERKSYGDKPRSDRPYGDRPSGGDRPRSDGGRPSGGGGGGYKGAPRGGQSGDRPSGGPGGRPSSGGRPSNGKPPFKPRRD